MANQNRLRDACQRANEKAALSVLSKSNSNPADPLHIYTDDGNKTILHYICAGQPVGALSRILLGWPEGIRPSPGSKERAALLSSLLNLYPEILQLACLQDQNKGLTPVHLCVQSASIEVLRILVTTAQKYFGQNHAALLFSVPDSLGRTALCIALASQQWEAVALLLDTAALSHAGIQASYRISESLGCSAGGGGGGRGSSRRGIRQSTLSSSFSFVAAGSGASAVITGAVGGVLNKLWDSWGGSRDEVEIIEKHKTEFFLSSPPPAVVVGSITLQDAGNGHEGSDSASGSCGDITATADKGTSLNSTTTIAAAAGAASWEQLSKLPSVSVLGDLSAVQRRQQNQVDRVAGILNISIAEAMQLLMNCTWDEAAALSAGALDKINLNDRDNYDVLFTKAKVTQQLPTISNEDAEKNKEDNGLNGTLQINNIEEKKIEVDNEDANISDGYQSAAEHEQDDEQEEKDEFLEHENLKTVVYTRNNTRTCMVCFEEIDIGSTPRTSRTISDNSTTSTGMISTNDNVKSSYKSSLSKVSRYLPCSQDHFTCDICWKGILNSNPQSACCPYQQCRLPLPLKAAEVILPRRKFERVSQLVAEKYVQTAHDLRWCPAAGCSMCLQLPSGERGSGKVAGAAAAAGRGVDAFCSTCGHSSCWSCGECSHEPATCAQARTWENELAALRALAPVSDKRWLAKNAKQCPGCCAYIQRTGGCNHMTCGCGKHFCWECGRDWSQHNADTGGFYFCSLVENEQEENSAEDEENTSENYRNRSNNATSSIITTSNTSSSGWLRDIWKSVHNVAGEATLHWCLQMQLRHECDEVAVRALAVYIQEICRKMAGSSSLSDEKTKKKSEKYMRGAHGGPAAAKIGAGALICRRSGPEQVGVSTREAAEMRASEWATVMATACRSAAENGDFNPKHLKLENSLSKKDTTDIEERLQSKPSSTINTENTVVASKIEFPALASLIIEAHATLKNAAACLRALSGGPRRRYLVELCEEAERSLALFEPVLMDAPYQTEAVEVGRELLISSITPPSAATTRQTPPPQQQQQQQRGGFRGALSSFIQNFKGVPALDSECRIPGVPAHVIVEQAHYVAAVQRQARKLNIEKHAVALQKAVNGLKDAGRKGLFA